MGLSDRLNEADSSSYPGWNKVSHPNGWEPGVKFDSETGVPSEVTSPPVPELAAGNYEAVLESMNIQLPEGFELKLVEAKFDPAAWHRDQPWVEHPETGKITRPSAVTRPVWRYRFRVEQTKPFLLSEDDLQALSDKVRDWNVTPNNFQSNATPVAAVLNLADMQLFKPEGGGLDATLERLERALSSFKHFVIETRDRGFNLNELVIVNNGDPFEGIAGNYANQSHTVQGGLRAQMNAVLDVWLVFCRELYPLFEKRQFVSVLCNHTQFGRQGGAKNSITGDEDNGGAFLAETLERILHSNAEFEDVSFTIPHDEMNVYTTAAGITLGFNHGHKIPKKDASGFESWLNGQVRADGKAYDVRVWFTAHRHNFQFFDVGSCSVMQTPSCDGGSKWLTDRTGTHSNSGVLATLVGEHHRLGWSDVQFL